MPQTPSAPLRIRPTNWSTASTAPNTRRADRCPATSRAPWVIDATRIGDPPALDVGRRRTADQRREDLVALAEDPVTGGAFRRPDLLPLLDRPRPLRQPEEIGTHIDVPGRDLALGRRTTYPREVPCRERGRGREARAGDDQRAAMR